MAHQCTHGLVTLLDKMLLLLLLLQQTAGLRVLMVSTVSSRSHSIWANALTEGLVDASHQVVELTTLPPAAPHPNRTTFAVGKFLADLDGFIAPEDMASMGPFDELNIMTQFRLGNNHFTLQSEAFQDLVQHIRASEFKADVMVIDYAFEETLIGLAGLTGRPPIVAITAYLHPVEFSTLMGNPHLPPLVPHETLEYGVRMGLLERASNFFRYLMYAFAEHWYFWPAAEQMYRQHFGKAAPSMAELAGDIALALVNTHPALHGARPLVPSIVEVGLMQVRPGKPLPKGLQSWLDGATEGFVFLSFGTIVDTALIKPEKKQAILNAFASLKQRVLWKCDAKDLASELPPNVRVEKWLPQNDILAHPKIKAFVSHAGALSSMELAYHGVPVLSVPFFADQFKNAEKNQQLGLGRTLKFTNLNSDTFLEALTDVIQNPKYRRNARRVSDEVRDQKETPLQRAVWWVEYVARRGGAPHLRSHALDLRWYELYLLDVLGLALLVPLAAGLLLWAVSMAVSRPRTRITIAHHVKRD